MICPNCAKQISDTAKVCGYCGTRLARPEPPPPAADKAPPPEVFKPAAQPQPVGPKPAALPPVEPRAARQAAEEAPPPAPVKQAAQPQPAAPKPAAPRKGLLTWAWVVIGLVVVAALAAGYMLFGQRPAPPQTAAAPATAAPAKPNPTAAPIQEEAEEQEPQLLRQYAEDWEGADLIWEYDFDDFAFFEPENNVEQLVYSANYEEGDGYIRLVGTGSWDTFFCEHHYQPGHSSVSVFSLEEGSNFIIGYQTAWANYGEEDYLWWGLSGPEGEAGTFRVDDYGNSHLLAGLEPHMLYWLMLANEDSDFLIRLGEVEEDIVLGEAILNLGQAWDLPEWRYCFNVGDGVVDLHYYTVRSYID